MRKSDRCLSVRKMFTSNNFFYYYFVNSQLWLKRSYRVGYVHHKGIIKAEASQLNFPKECQLNILKAICIN